MFVILSKPHEGVHEPLTVDGEEAALKRLRAGRPDVTAEEYQPLIYALMQARNTAGD